MSFVTTNPEVLSGAASSLSGIGDSMVARNAAAAAPTTSLAPAASDLVSAMTAAQFGKQGVAYQQLAAQATKLKRDGAASALSGKAYAKTSIVRLGGRALAVMTLQRGPAPEVNVREDKIAVGEQLISFDGVKES